MESVQERMERLGTYEKIASFMQKEKQPYEFKRKYAQIRAEEFATECDGRGLNYHVSVGGLDSIVLYLFLHAIELFITTELLFVLLRATKLMSLIKPTALDFS